MFKNAIAQVGNNYRRNAKRVLRNGVSALDQLVNSLLYPQQPTGLQLAGVNNFDLYNKSVFPQEDGQSKSLLDFGPILFAVPKSKISKSKKRIKNAMKRKLQPMKHLVTCRNCGATKERHRLCMACENPKPRRKVGRRTGYNWGWPHYVDEDFEDITDDTATKIPDNFLDDVVAIEDSEKKN